jgi:hypothetical protein
VELPQAPSGYAPFFKVQDDTKGAHVFLGPFGNSNSLIAGMWMGTGISFPSQVIEKQMSTNITYFGSPDTTSVNTYLQSNNSYVGVSPSLITLNAAGGGPISLQNSSSTLWSVGGTGGVQYFSTSVALTTGTTTLTNLQYRFPYITFTGTLTGNVTIVFPATLGAHWIIDFSAIVYSGFTITLQANSINFSSQITTNEVYRIEYGGLNQLYLVDYKVLPNPTGGQSGYHLAGIPTNSGTSYNWVIPVVIVKRNQALYSIATAPSVPTGPSALSVSVRGGVNQQIEGVVQLAAVGTGGIFVGYNGPSGMQAYIAVYGISTGSNMQMIQRTDTDTYSANIFNKDASTSPLVFNGVLINPGSVTGTFQFAIGAAAAGATCTVGTGSYLQFSPSN